MATSKLPPLHKATFFFLAAICINVVTSVPTGYLAKRTALIQAEENLRIGGNGSTLTPNERKVNEIMMREKRALIEATRLNGSYFPAGHNFLLSRAAMENTTAFRIIQKMPKGGVLHTHDEGMTSIDWLVKNVTYRDLCYMCVDKHYQVSFHFFNTPPVNPDCPWRLVSQFRQESESTATFDQSLHNNMTMVTADPDRVYTDVDAVWKKFMTYFLTMEGLMLYAPVFEDYLWEGLGQFRQDNVQYVEIRGLLPSVYELDSSTHNSTWVMDLYKRVVNGFVSKYPDFSGVKIIMSSLRLLPESDILSKVKEATRLYREYPGFMVGFDLVGQEDPYHPLLYYIDALLYPSQQNPPVHLPYFFHAGETNWQDAASDYNLVDAILLNTTRIGHGYALYKHPKLMESVRSQNIAVEVSPISNQVLKLVADLRNHPVAELIAEDMPVVISSDDNAAWEALPLTHDFYVTFMALTGEDTGLATLKRLAYNSLRYSAMSAGEKDTAIQLWLSKWDAFINDIRDGPTRGMARNWKTLAQVSVLLLAVPFMICKPLNRQQPPSQAPADNNAGAEDKGTGLEYDRYLKQVVDVLESDDEFRKQLESANISDIKSGAIAMHLQLVNRTIRTKLDEIKRMEIQRLQQLARLKTRMAGEGKRQARMELPDHLDVRNPHSFEIRDLENLILKTTRDLEEVDGQRRKEFKEYEIEKEYEYQDKLKNLPEGERQKTEEQHQQLQEKHKEHEKIQHPGSKDQFEEVWEKEDKMEDQDFDPKTFFMMHDLNEDKFWDIQEVEAVLQRELEKVYDARNSPEEDDPMEKEEEMNRMREHVFTEIDTDKDLMISIQEFLQYTGKNGDNKKFEENEGWETVDQKPAFTDEEYQQYIQQHHAQPGEVPPPVDNNLHFQPEEQLHHQQQQFQQEQQRTQQGMPQGVPQEVPVQNAAHQQQGIGQQVVDQAEVGHDPAPQEGIAQQAKPHEFQPPHGQDQVVKLGENLVHQGQGEPL
ncbi:hypothetical protein ACOMHN_024964 [Nucella lapillus]